MKAYVVPPVEEYLNHLYRQLLRLYRRQWRHLAAVFTPCGLVSYPHLPVTSTDNLIDDSGKLVTTSGALIPDKYKLDDSLPERPMICPVRSCRRLHGSMHMLGQHFKVSTGSVSLD